jgi:hypothetical protein
VSFTELPISLPYFAELVPCQYKPAWRTESGILVYNPSVRLFLCLSEPVALAAEYAVAAIVLVGLFRLAERHWLRYLQPSTSNH